jgi:hypothetical protein
MTPEQTLDWLAEQHKSQCNEDRPVQEWIRSMKSMLPAPVQEPVAIPHEWRKVLRKLAFMARTSGGTVGHDSGLSAACEEAEALLSKPYATPPAAQRQRVVFPTMLRKMWSGGEVQKWLDENVNKENT